MGGFSAASAAERCAVGIHARSSSSPASFPRVQQQQSGPLRRGSRRAAAAATLAVSRRSLVVPRAVAAPTDRASPDIVGRFKLESNSELQVTLNPAPQGAVAEINLEATNTSGSLILHWGALRPERREWLLPSRRPDGTSVYKNKALRTPFVKSGDNSTLRIEIDDPAVQAIEFLVFDEAKNKWFKNNGQNFLIQLQTSRTLPSPPRPRSCKLVFESKFVCTMDESRKRAASTADAKNISSSFDEDFGNDFLSSWKLPKSGKDTIDFDVESVSKSSKKFSFDNLNDFGLDGAFDKISSFKMGMSDLDFSSPLKKKVKHNSSNGINVSEGKKEIDKENFSFFFDFNELGKFNLDAKLGFEENGMSRLSEKADPISSEGNKDPRRGLSGKGTDIPEDNKSKEQTQTQDACTLKPTHLTSINPARMEQDKVDMVSNDRHEEHSKEIYPTKAAVNKSYQIFPCSAVSGEDLTHSRAIAVPENSKEAPEVELSKVNISGENNNTEPSVSSQSRNTSTGNPYISRKSVGQSESQNNQNEVVEESTSLNEGSHGSQCFRGTSRKPLKQISCGTKNVEEGTSGLKNLSSSMQREIRNVKPALANETGSFSLLSMKTSRPPQLTSDTTLNQLSGGNNVIKKINTHPTDLKREHNHERPEKSKIVLAKTYCKPALQGLPTTSMNAKLGVAKVGTRSPKSDLLLEKDSVQVSGSKGTPVITSKIPNSFFEGKPALLSPSMRQTMPEESVPEPNAPAVLKRIMRSPAVRKSPQTVPELGNQTILSGTPKAHMDNEVTSTMPCEMGDISDLELPALLENDGNVEKAEACRKELEDMCISLKRKHTEAKELAVRAIVNNNTMLMLNHPMFEEKISALQKYANSLRSKKHLFEEISAIDAH